MTKISGTREWSTQSANIQRGCSSFCLYCFACFDAVKRWKTVASYSDWRKPVIIPTWVNKVYTKVDGRIMFPTQHDIDYNNLEHCCVALKNMLEPGNMVLIVTKPRHACVAELCKRFEPFKAQILFRFTIGAIDNSLLKHWEPGAPPFEERFDSLKTAFNAGFQTSVSCEPCLDLPNYERLFAMCEPFVTDGIWLGMMNKIDLRVKITCAKDVMQTNKVRLNQTKENYELIYSHLKDNPKARWKGEVKKILGLEQVKKEGDDR